MRVTFDPLTEASARQLIQMGLTEDLQEKGDLSSQALISSAQSATVNITARASGVISGTRLIQIVFELLRTPVHVQIERPDGDPVESGSVVATVSGPLNALLTGERTVLNLLCHLSGIASVTAAFVARVHGTRAVILDTRKTLPGYRLLHKYAVRCGGGTNHRMGLYDVILIKDNHLAAHRGRSVAMAVSEVRAFLRTRGLNLPVEIEVDTLNQFRESLAEHPEIVLLDNMTPPTLAEAVRIRNELAPRTRLEASGGITLENVRDVAETGVERISVGELTHSAPALDLGFDFPD